MQKRCYQCFRPISLCFCEAIPRIDNRTDVLILQHVGERCHPFNTARIVRKSLRRCRLIADHNQRLGMHWLPIHADAGLLFPGADALPLTDLSAADRPSQLVIVDGTWHQAKTIVRDVPQLRGLPCYRLSPSSPGQYRIRREPDAQSLSTLEATVAALRVLEPATTGLDQLLTAFHEMVAGQLSHPAGHAAWRQNSKRQSRPRHLPHALSRSADGLIVAYGESSPGGPRLRPATASPVSWVAQRLGTAERFSCRLRQEPPLSDSVLRHMRLSAADFDTAVSPDEFHAQWGRFLRPDDVLIVYHQRTIQLLRHIDTSPPRCVVLKSIVGQWHAGIQSLEELMVAEGVACPRCNDRSRAVERLDMAVALVEHLRMRVGPSPVA